MSNKNGKLSLSNKMAYGGGSFALALLLANASSWITYFFTEQVGFAAAVAGTVLLIGRCFDGISDLVMGAIVDKTHSKHGKARPWILWMAVPFLIASSLLWFAPELSMPGKIAYAISTYIFGVGIIYTMIAIPFNTLCSLMTIDGKERTSLSTFRTFFSFAGTLIVGSLTLQIVQMFGGGQKGWLLMGIAYGILGAILLVITFFFSKEIEQPVSSDSVESITEKDEGNILENIKIMLTSKCWWLIIGSMFFCYLLSGFGSVNAYYAQFVLNDVNATSLMTISTMLPLIAGVLITPLLVKKFGNRNTALISMSVAAIGALLTGWGDQFMPVLLGGLALRGFGSGPTTVVLFSMVGDIADYCWWKSGKKMNGLAFSCAGFAEKIGTALGGFLLTVFMQLFGYISGAVSQSEHAIFGLRLLLTHIPCSLCVIIVILIALCDIEKKMPEIRESLNQKL